MNIVVPFTHLSDGTVDALKGLGLSFTAHPLNWGTDYWRLLRDVWAAGETVLIVEHDIIPTLPAVERMIECAGDWCASPYPYYTSGNYAGLGFTRFRPGIMRRDPTLWDRVHGMSDSKHSPGHWCRLDAWSQTAANETRCIHYDAPVGHLNTTRPAHDCLEAS